MKSWNTFRLVILWSLIYQQRLLIKMNLMFRRFQMQKAKVYQYELLLKSHFQNYDFCWIKSICLRLLIFLVSNMFITSPIYLLESDGQNWYCKEFIANHSSLDIPRRLVTILTKYYLFFCRFSFWHRRCWQCTSWFPWFHNWYSTRWNKILSTFFPESWQQEHLRGVHAQFTVSFFSFMVSKFS